jgi:hypothetical protein
MGQWPSAELKPPGPRQARISLILWWLLFALAVGAAVVGAWSSIRTFVQPGEFDPVAAGSAAPGWFAVGLLVADTLAAALYLGVALLLWRRRPFDPVSRRMSFAFLFMAHVGTGAKTFWGDSELHYLLAAVGVLLMIVTLPAYPNGVYVPRAARWLRAFVPVGVLLVAVAGVASFVTPAADLAMVIAVLLAAGLTLSLLLLLVAGLILPLVRCLRMPPGLEKQQVKWAALGLSAGFLLMFVAFVVQALAAIGTIDDVAHAWLPATVKVIAELGFALIPAGVGVSLLEYRLNDADAAAGKSLGYAMTATIVLGVAGVIQSLVDSIAHKGGPIVTAFLPLAAALLFTPARNYLLSWTERKFQPALVRLRQLPEKLARWQTCSAPDELAELALADLVPGVGAAYAAILGDDGNDWRVLAARGIEPEEAMAQLTAVPAPDQQLRPFPIRIPLADQIGKDDLLAIGPRSDGASFTRDENCAIAMVVGPLSTALQTSALRSRHTFKVENSLEGIDSRLSKIENSLGGGGPQAV